MTLTPTTNRFLALRLSKIESQAKAKERQRITQLIRAWAVTTDDHAAAEELIALITTPGERPDGALLPSGRSLAAAARKQAVLNGASD